MLTCCVHSLGAGGNAAIEYGCALHTFRASSSLTLCRTVAALANELKKMVDASDKGKPSFADIKAHLGNYQAIREERVTAVLEAANGLTRIQALQTWKDRWMALWLMPLAGDA
jgi:hypothetical protein